jgi:hypothetical protein
MKMIAEAKCGAILHGAHPSLLRFVILHFASTSLARARETQRDAQVTEHSKDSMHAVGRMSSGLN